MRSAYLLIFIPAVLVGIVYFVLFHSLGLQIQPLPFIGAVLGFVAAVVAVRYYLRTHKKRPGS